MDCYKWGRSVQDRVERLRHAAEQNGDVEEEFAYSKVIDLMAEALNEVYEQPTPGRKP